MLGTDRTQTTYGPQVSVSKGMVMKTDKTFKTIMLVTAQNLIFSILFNHHQATC